MTLMDMIKYDFTCLPVRHIRENHNNLRHLRSIDGELSYKRMGPSILN
mgnify:CR=1 FL=1